MSEARSNPPATAVQLQGVVRSRSSLATVGFTTPNWNSLWQGLRPRQPELDELDPGVPSHGWQFFAALSVEHHFRSCSVWPRLTPTEQTLLRSQSGPVAGLPFFFHPDFVALAFSPSALPLSCSSAASGFPCPLSRTSGCGRPLDVLGHHRATCSKAGVLGSRGFSVESAATKVCREAGACVSLNAFVRDLDLPVAQHDGQRLEVVAHGLPLFGGAQLAIDTTCRSPCRWTPESCASEDETALLQAAGNNVVIPICQEPMGERVWWSLLPT